MVCAVVVVVVVLLLLLWRRRVATAAGAVATAAAAVVVAMAVPVFGRKTVHTQWEATAASCVPCFLGGFGSL